MQAKRILILTNRVPYPLNDGGNLAMKAVVDGYKQNGWEVFLLSMNTTRHYVHPDVLAGIYKDIAAFETVDVNNNVRLLPTLSNFFFSSEPNHAARFRHIGFRKKLVEALDNFRPDVVQAESPYLSVYLPDIQRYANVFTVLRMHNIEYQVWNRLAAETKNPLKRVYLRNLAARIKRFEEKAWAGYDVLLPITRYDEEVVISTLHSPQVYTVPFGININNRPVVAQPGNWVGYHIGAMDWLPNVEGIRWFIAEVWPRLRQTVPDFEFYFAGRNMPDEFKKIDIPGVHCMGEVPDAGLFIADKKILIVPIRSGGGIRVKILEALAVGKIVISTGVGMQGIDAVNGQHYLEANTPDEFVTAIKWCLDNREEAENIGHRGSLLVKTMYNAGTLASKLSEVLLSRLKRHLVER